MCNSKLTFIIGLFIVFYFPFIQFVEAEVDINNIITGTITTTGNDGAHFITVDLTANDPVNGTGHYTAITNFEGVYSVMVDWPIGTNFTLEYLSYGDWETSDIISGNVTNTNLILDYGPICGNTWLEQGWNLLSIPCTNHLVDGVGVDNQYHWMNATSSNNPTGSPIVDSSIFDWNEITNQYDLVEIYDVSWLNDNSAGWWIFAYSSCKLNFLYAPIPLSWSFSAVEGWNLIGGAFYRNKGDIDVWVDGTTYTWSEAVNLGHIINDVFEWNAISQSYYLTTIFSGYQGQWMYANTACWLD